MHFTIIDLAFFFAALVLSALIWLSTSQGLSCRNVIDRIRNSLQPKRTASDCSIWNALCHKVFVLILYGSQTGTAESFAFSLHSFLLSHSISSAIMSIENLPLDKFRARCDAPGLFSLFILATYGDGEPADSALSFVQYLERPPTKSLKTNYAVFGLGNSSYLQFNACAKLVDRLLHRHGGIRLLHPIFGDELQDQERMFLNWQSQVTEALSSHFHTPNLLKPGFVFRPLYHKQPVSRSALANGKVFIGEPHILGSYEHQKGPFNSKNPFLAEVLVNRELYTSGTRSCKHIELDISGSSFSYRPGDHVAVLPSNPRVLVEMMGDLLRVILDEPFTLISNETLILRKSPFPCPCTYRTALTHYVDLTGPPSLRILATLAEFAKDRLEAEKLRLFASNTADGLKCYTKYVVDERRTVVNILSEFTSVRIPAELLLELLPRLKPRLYSISCSPTKTDSGLHITVASVVEQTPRGKEFHGLATHWLGALSPGTSPKNRVPVYLKTSSFHPPRSSKIPIIMISTGTGLAPFRAFIQERQSYLDTNGSTVGIMLLFFGCRNKSEFIYSDEIQGAHNTGLIQLHLALSREPGIKKTYVQDLLRKMSTDIWRLMDTHHAHVYVCGSVAMVRDVQKCIIDVVSVQSNKSMDWAKEYMDGLRTEGRYHVDVWS